MSGDDPRTGPTESGFVTITDALGDAPQTAVEIPDKALFRMTGIEVVYADAGTGTNVEVGVFDEADGTAAGSVSDQRLTFRSLSGGDTVTRADLDMREFEEDVLVQSVGDNHDADIDVTVFGQLLVAPKDVRR